MVKKEKYYKLLMGHSIFQGIDKEEIPKLLNELGGHFENCKKQEIIREAGEPFDLLGIVLTGIVQASMPNLEKEQIIERFPAGSSFGEAAVFGNRVSPVEIIALEPSVIVFIPAMEIINGYNNPNIAKLGMNLLQETAQKTQKLSMKIRILKEKRLRVRIMIYLRSLTPDKDGVLTLPYNKTELAQYLGANRSSLSREFTMMSEAGIIEIDRQKVKILNPRICNILQEEKG